jgi:hypothetical protein
MVPFLLSAFDEVAAMGGGDASMKRRDQSLLYPSQRMSGGFGS